MQGWVVRVATLVHGGSEAGQSRFVRGLLVLGTPDLTARITRRTVLPRVDEEVAGGLVPVPEDLAVTEAALASEPPLEGGGPGSAEVTEPAGVAQRGVAAELPQHAFDIAEQALRVAGFGERGGQCPEVGLGLEVDGHVHGVSPMTPHRHRPDLPATPCGQPDHGPVHQDALASSLRVRSILVEVGVVEWHGVIAVVHAMRPARDKYVR